MAPGPPTHMMKAAASAAIKRGLGTVVPSGRFPDLDVPGADPSRFVVAFCGSGTGHMTQAATVARLLMEQGFELCGVVTDQDADERLLAEVVRPLCAEVLVLPSITLVTPAGVASPHRVVASARQASGAIRAEDERIRGFFRESRCGLVLNFFHTTLAWFLKTRRLPETVRVLSVAAQFAIGRLPPSRLPSLQAVIAKSAIDVMNQIFAASGPCIPLTARDDDGSGGVAPVIELPAPLGGGAGPGMPRLVLCYFLVTRAAVRLERLLHRHPIEGVAFHCFTATALTPPKGRQLSIRSHAKERRLFKELFAQCTGVIVSSGNETIWEAVCRGVPVLTLPTAGHGEQVINSVLHARNHPNLVRARRKLDIGDVRWVANFDGDSASRAESERLRAWSTEGGASRLISIVKEHAHAPCIQPEVVLSI